MYKGQAAWWRPETTTPPWYEIAPKREEQAVVIVSVNNKEGTAVVEYLDTMRRPINHIAQLHELRPRELTK
jgi:hypothetical protein